jgi:hypothetical protein
MNLTALTERRTIWLPLPQPWIAVAVVFAGTILFALLQNHLGFTGGPISNAKTLWLSYALQMFLVVPFCFWRCDAYSANVRRIFGAVFLSFAIRGLIELYILYFTRAWECIYGISHDLFTFALVVVLLKKVSNPSAQDRRALRFVPILLCTLIVECFMAWQFSRLASPADGIYFAADTEHFRLVNLWSWIAVGIGYPALLSFLWITRKDFYELETADRQTENAH